MPDIDIKRVVDKLIGKKEAVELVKLMKPLDVAKVVATDLGLCPKDASRATMNLIKRAHVPRREGLAPPSIEKLPYPVPNHLDKSGEPLMSKPTYHDDDEDDVNEMAGAPSGKSDMTPRFDIKRWHFPPDPRNEPDGWPYDDMTKKSMEPGSKSRKRPLMTSKEDDSEKVKVYNFQVRNTDVNSPGGAAGHGGGSISKPAPHLRHNNMSSRGQSWDRKGVAGWSSSPSGEEFDLPESELHGTNAGDSDDVPNFMKPAPVGSSIPTLNKSRPSPGLRKGFRRR